MKNLFRSTLLPAVFLLSLAPMAHGIPLAPGTLEEYIALGSAGGQIGDTLFSDFAVLSIPTGADPIDPSAVTVNPVNNALGPGLEFVVDQAAVADQFFDIRIFFQVSDDTLSGVTLSMAGSSATGDGTVTAVEEFSPGDVLDPLDPDILTLTTFHIAGIDDTFEQLGFPTATGLGVILDIGVDGGRVEVDPEGTAALSSVTTQFTVVSSPVIPEPATLVLLTAGLGYLGFCRRRRA